MPRTWEQFEVVGDAASAELLAGRLRVDGVPAKVESQSPIPGLNEGFRVLIPAGMAQHARSIVASAQPSEAELIYLATGQLPGNEDDSGVDR